MVNRCTNPKSKDWINYGGRGIAVCDRWRSYENFMADMPARPSGRHSLERLDNDIGYEPGNVIWALPKTQGANRRNTVKLDRGGVVKTIGDWAEETGIPKPTLYWRHKKGLRGDELFHRATSC